VTFSQHLGNVNKRRQHKITKNLPLYAKCPLHQPPSPCGPNIIFEKY